MLVIKAITEEGLVSKEEIDKLVIDHVSTGNSLVFDLINKGLITEEDLFFLLSRQSDSVVLPEARLHQISVTSDLRRCVPRRFALKNLVVPIGLNEEGDRLSVAMVDPTDHEVIEQIKTIAKVSSVQTYLARFSVIESVIEKGYELDKDEISVEYERELLKENTQVEVIPGKVSLDPQLVEEMEALSPDLVDEAMANHRFNQEDEIDTQVIHVSKIDGAQKQDPDVQRDESSTEEILTQPITEDREHREDAVTNELPDITKIALYEQSERDASDVMSVVGNAEFDRFSAVKTNPLARELPILDLDSDGSDEDSLITDLQLGVSSLVKLVENVIAHDSLVVKEYEFLAYQIGKEVSLDDQSLRGVVMAAQLFALNHLLNQKSVSSLRVEDVFALDQNHSRLNAALRRLGRRCLDMDIKDSDRTAVAIVNLIADFIKLKRTTEDSSETIVQTLRDSGIDPLYADALMRSISEYEFTTEKTTRVKVH